MATGILAILDDVAALLDDTATMSKIAAKKTAGLLGDDLAVNAEKATGFKASRELPVLWAITKGSFLNKLIILPCAFVLNAWLPWMIVPVLLLGGSYLSYEGAEHVLHWLFHQLFHRNDKTAKPGEATPPDEPAKIRSAVRTDFILSIEIVVISLSSVIGQTLVVQILVVGAISILATVGVYSLVALIVRMDDAGLYLLERAATANGAGKRILTFSGNMLVALLPKVIRLLAVVGTLAMLLVGGGIVTHYIEPVHHLLEFMPSLLADLSVGMVLGSLLVLLISQVKTIRSKLFR